MSALRAEAVRRLAVPTLVAALAVLAAWLASEVPILRSTNHAIENLRFAASPRAEPQNSVVIAIDNESLRAFPDWPWPRSRYAEILTRIEEAGGEAVFFDIDFSTRREGDEIFARAIADAEVPVYLPAFVRSFEAMPEVVAEIEPHAGLRGDAELVSTVYPVDRDGLVRRIPEREVFSHGDVPHIAWSFSGESPPAAEAHVDFALDPDSLPVYSFTDVFFSGLPAGSLQGKTVFVGATAVELGDEFAVPVHGLIPGVVLSALAFETASQKRVLTQVPLAFVCILTGLVALAAFHVPQQETFRRHLILNGFLFLLLSVGGYALQAFAGLMWSTGVAHIAQGAGVLLAVAVSANDAALASFRSRMAVEKHASILTAMMRSNHDGLIVADYRGLIEQCNPAAATYLGLASAEQAVGQALSIVARPLMLPDDDTSPSVVRLSTQGQDDRFVSVSRTIVPLVPANSRFERRRKVRNATVLTLHDLTAQKNAEFAERSAREAHEKASAAKTALLSTMSHELRTPLNAICGFSDIIAEASLGPHQVSQYAEFGRTIRSSGTDLLRTIDGILLAGQLKSGSVQPNDVEFGLEPLVSSVLELVRERPHWRRPAIAVEVSGVVLRADHRLTTAMIFHLVDNAAKFGGEDADVAISADPATGKLVIEDRGPGIGARSQDELTRLMHQADGSSTRRHEGCGLGLTLVQDIADLQGIPFKIANREGGGCRAVLSFGDRLYLRGETGRRQGMTI